MKLTRKRAYDVMAVMLLGCLVATFVTQTWGQEATCYRLADGDWCGPSSPQQGPNLDCPSQPGHGNCLCGIPVPCVSGCSGPSWTIYGVHLKICGEFACGKPMCDPVTVHQSKWSYTCDENCCIVLQSVDTNWGPDCTTYSVSGNNCNCE